jgi:hypothetical protein
MRKHTLRTSIDVSTSGPNEVIQGVEGKRIRIYKLVVWAGDAVTMTLEDGDTPINGSGFNLPAQAGFTYDADSYPLVLDNSFIITLSDPVQVSGWVQYTLEG